MKIVNTIDQNRVLLTATNDYGRVSLSVLCNRTPTMVEGIEIMKSVGYWMDNDKITMSPCHKEIMAFLE
jgi:hypothetical protein